ncbi:MAG: hypothetical protein V4586_08630 [Pseudomonadota bacterium]
MRAFAMIGMAGLSACVSGARPMALAESGPVAVDLAGQSYIADLQPSEAGATLAVTRDGAGFGNFEGAEAKRVAAAFCATRGASVSRAAYGHYVGGAWVFKGGCA